MNQTKTGLSLNPNQAEYLKKRIHRGEIIPVEILSKISDSIYLIRLKNIEVTAFSSLELIGKKAFIRVKETEPIPNLQLQIHEEAEAEYTLWQELFEEGDQLDPLQWHIWQQYRHLFHNNPGSSLLPKKIMNALILKLKQRLIPMTLFFGKNEESIPIRDFTEIYTPLYLEMPILDDSPRLSPVSRLQTDKAEISQKLSSLSTINRALVNTNYRLDIWYFHKNNGLILFPVEMSLSGKGQIRTIVTQFNSRHFGQIYIRYEQTNLLIEIENSIYLSHLKGYFEKLRENIRLLKRDIRVHWQVRQGFGL